MKLKVDSPAYVVAFAALLSAAFTAAVVSVQVATAGRVARNEALREQKALVQVFGLGDPEGMSSDAIADVVRRRVAMGDVVADPKTGRRFRVFRAYADEARDPAGLQAVAFEFTGTGFWAPITGLLALTPDLSRVTGMAVVDQSETPGLGGRIMEKWFQEQFGGLNAAPPKPGRRFLYVVREKPAGADDPRYGRAVEAITGATQTSLCLERLLNASIEQFRRAWQKHLVSELVKKFT